MEYLCSRPLNPSPSSALYALRSDAEFHLQRFPANARLDDPQRFADVARRYRSRAEALAVLRRSMEGLDLSEAQRFNLEAFGRDDALAVLTGQQAGILGGPVFTALKAAGAVQMAQRLDGVSAEFGVVPIFWVEDNDHDVEEISELNFLDREQEAAHMHLRWPGLRRRTMVSQLEFGPTLEQLFTDWEMLTLRSLHLDDTMAVLRSIYRTDVSPGRAFRDWLHTLFAEKGLLFVMASECRSAGLFADIAGRELAEPGASRECMQPLMREFASRGITAQVEPSALNLFLVENGRRMKLDVDANFNFTAEGLPVERARIEAQFDADRSVLTPNVLLRPVMQDRIFPTLAYIAGPGERSYAAQLRELYERYDVPMPAWMARPHAALLSAGFQRRREQLGLDFDDLRRDADAVNGALVQPWSPKEWTSRAGSAEVNLRDIYAALAGEVRIIDSSLDAVVEQEMHKTLEGLKRLDAKVRRAVRRRHQDDLRRMYRMHSEYYPRGGPQDRNTSSGFMATRYGLAAFRDFVLRAAEKWEAGEMIFAVGE